MTHALSDCNKQFSIDIYWWVFSNRLFGINNFMSGIEEGIGMGNDKLNKHHICRKNSVCWCCWEGKLYGLDLHVEFVFDEIAIDLGLIRWLYPNWLCSTKWNEWTNYASIVDQSKWFAFQIDVNWFRLDASCINILIFINLERCYVSFIFQFRFTMTNNSYILLLFAKLCTWKSALRSWFSIIPQTQSYLDISIWNVCVIKELWHRNRMIQTWNYYFNWFAFAILDTIFWRLQ